MVLPQESCEKPFIVQFIFITSRQGLKFASSSVARKYLTISGNCEQFLNIIVLNIVFNLYFIYHIARNNQLET